MKYVVRCLEDAEAKGWVNGAGEPFTKYYDKDRYALFLVEDGEVPRAIYIDGGEPEDMNLNRDLSVLVDELNRIADMVNAQFETRV